MILTTIGVLAAMTLHQSGSLASPSLAANLAEALQDERYSEAFYKGGIQRWNAQRPFTNLVQAEGVHITLVTDLMSKYGIKPQPNPFVKRPKELQSVYLNRIGVPETMAAGFTRAIKFEKEQGPLYDRLSIGMPDDVKQVFASLKFISIIRHLPALERSSSGAGQGWGRGRGNGLGRGNVAGQGLCLPGCPLVQP
jgi:hypothetical protein